MTNETYEKILRYLENQDKSGNYDTMSDFLSEINKRFELKFMIAWSWLGNKIPSVI